MQLLTKDIKISDIIERVKILSSDAPEPKDLCWITIGYEDFCHNYCPDCAKEILNWLRDGGEQPEFWDGEEYPTYAAIDKKSNYYNSDVTGYESEGVEICQHCGHHLEVVLLEYGVESELDHFEEHGIKTAGEWREFLDVCKGIEYVEQGRFPGSWMKDYQIERAKRLYERTLLLAAKTLATRIDRK